MATITSFQYLVNCDDKCAAVMKNDIFLIVAILIMIVIVMIMMMSIVMVMVMVLVTVMLIVGFSSQEVERVRLHQKLKIEVKPQDLVGPLSALDRG